MGRSPGGCNLSGGHLTQTLPPHVASRVDPDDAAVNCAAERPETRTLTARPLRPAVSLAGYATDVSASSLLIGLQAHLEQRPACRAFEAAGRFGMSQRTFQRRLRELGTSFQQEINAAHLRIAKRLMQETDNPLKWIAIESGYASLQHFSSSFRARMGLSPSAWRAGSSVPKQAR